MSDQQDREAYNTMVKARDMLMGEAAAEQKRYGKTPRYKSLILGAGALIEILENIDRNGGTYIMVTRIQKDVSKYRSLINRLTNKENRGTQEQA